MNKIDEPQVTVVIPTRNRGERVVKTVLSILKNNYPCFALRIIDQGEDDLTEKSLQPFLENPHFHYLRSPTQGASTGRNIGIHKTQSEFIALTDDDCEVTENWLEALMAAFALDHRIGVVFGNVEAGPHDSTQGFIPAYRRKGPFLACNIYEMHRVNGLSACMGLRRSVWQALGGFDEMLGAGGEFRSAEEMDFVLRTLLAGYLVYETPDVMVTHQGFRTWEQGKNLVHGYLYGIGAMFAKHFKCGHWAAFHLLCHLAWRWAWGGPVVNLGHRPSRRLRIIAFTKGFMAGWKTPMDRTMGHFISSDKTKMKFRR